MIDRNDVSLKIDIIPRKTGKLTAANTRPEKNGDDRKKPSVIVTRSDIFDQGLLFLIRQRVSVRLIPVLAFLEFIDHAIRRIHIDV